MVGQLGLQFEPRSSDPSQTEHELEFEASIGDNRVWVECSYSYSDLPAIKILAVTLMTEDGSPMANFNIGGIVMRKDTHILNQEYLNNWWSSPYSSCRGYSYINGKGSYVAYIDAKEYITELAIQKLSKYKGEPNDNK